MIDIEKNILERDNKNRLNKIIEPKYITIHNTGDLNAKASLYNSYMRTNSRGVSWHFTVDDTTIIQHLPLNEKGIHCQSGNSKSIGIEICMYKGMDEEKAHKNARDLCGYLMKVLNIPLSNIVRHHYWYPAKNCPETLMNNTKWQNFLNGIKQPSFFESVTEMFTEDKVVNQSLPEPLLKKTTKYLENLMDISIDNYNNKFINNSSLSNLKTIKGIHGMPYQFTSEVDTKISDIDPNVQFPYGRKYTERIINKMPMLLLSPGSPVFLDGYSKKTKTNLLKAASEAVVKQDMSEVNKLLDNNEGRFYTFKFNYKDYYDYVNGMCRTAAIYLGIQNKTFNGVKYQNYDWSTFVNDGLQNFFSGSEYVCFYINAEDQITVNFSNSTGPSMLDNGINKMSDMGKEISFLLNAGAGLKWEQMHKDMVDATFEDADKILSSMENPNHIIERLKRGSMTVIGGGEMIFPEIWKDSSYSNSYDVTIKLNSPDGDTESIYRNILVPMYHLMGFALPLQMGQNGFKSPFLVKGFLKGLIHCDLGMVGNMSIKRGNDGAWNVDGLPTEVEINFSFKDLYQILTMTKWSDMTMLRNNTPYLDFIATSCGVILNKPDILRKMSFFKAQAETAVTDIPRNVMKSFSQASSNVLLKSLKD